MATEKGKLALADMGGGIPPKDAGHNLASLTAEPAAAPAGGTGTSAGGWDTAGNRDTAITCINTTRTRVAEIEQRLKDLGIL